MANADACPFCRIVAGQADASLVLQDAQVTAFMDVHPVTPGHVLVVPNRHAGDLQTLDEDSARALVPAARRVAEALRRSTVPCDGVNLLLADGVVAGQMVFHVHLHVIPRSRGDGFGFRRPLGSLRSPGRAALEATAAAIRASLDTAGPSGEGS
jgi:diadenosine tetraphosphate (Ap4A) HIT family hydrolase